jgi:hypothetical protein
MTCPTCAAVLDVDPACVIDEPILTRDRCGAPRRRTKLAAAVLCPACEYCAELRNGSPIDDFARALNPAGGALADALPFSLTAQVSTMAAPRLSALPFDDEDERTGCLGCGDSWQVTDSHATDPDVYCSRACERSE